MLAAVVYANGAVVQIGPHGLRHLVLQMVMLHQPFAKLLVGGHARNDLIAVHTAQLYMSSNLKHIVQALLQLRVQRLGQMVAFHRIQPVYRLSQLVQLLERGIAVQPDRPEMPVECGNGTVCVAD